MEIVRDDEDRTVLREILDKGIAFGAECLVANRERFVHDQNIGGMRTDGKSKRRRHAARIEFDGLIQEIADTSEGGDRGKSRLDGGTPHTQNGASGQGIFPARQLMVEPGAKRKNRSHPPIDLHTAMRRQGDAADDLQQSGFPGAVTADDTDSFAAANLEGDVPQDPMLMVKLLPMPEDRLLELIVTPHIELERLADAIAANDKIR